MWYCVSMRGSRLNEMCSLRIEYYRIYNCSWTNNRMSWCVLRWAQLRLSWRALRAYIPNNHLCIYLCHWNNSNSRRVQSQRYIRLNNTIVPISQRKAFRHSNGNSLHSRGLHIRLGRSSPSTPSKRAIALCGNHWDMAGKYHLQWRRIHPFRQNIWRKSPFTNQQKQRSGYKLCRTIQRTSN